MFTKVSAVGWAFIIAFALVALVAVVVMLWGMTLPQSSDPVRCIEVGKYLTCFY